MMEDLKMFTDLLHIKLKEKNGVYILQQSAETFYV